MAALVTGLPLSAYTAQEELYLEGAPDIFTQDYLANPLWNPDGDGFYWGLSGTVTYPVSALGCYDSLALTEQLTLNDIVCDKTGYKSTVMRRNSVDLTLNILTMFPLSTMRDILKLGAVTQSGGIEKAGLGVIDNTRFIHIYMPKVFDDATSDWVAVHLHKARAIDAFTLNFRYGNSWQVTGIRFRAYAVDAYPEAQRFGMLFRRDPSALP